MGSFISAMLLTIMPFKAIVVVASNNVVSSTNEFRIDDVYKICSKLKIKHRVIVGSSWGSLSIKQQKFWMKSRCDKYFCQPNRLEGVGIYNCDPIIHVVGH